MRIYSSQSQQLEIPTNGLVQFYDFAVDNCWLSGTSVKDLSSGQTTCTYTVAPNVGSGFGRVANIPTSRYGTIPNTTVARLGDKAHTIIQFMRHLNEAGTVEYPLASSTDFAVRGDYYLLITNPGGTQANRTFRGHIYTTTNVYSADAPLGSMNNTNWHMVGQRWNGTSSFSAILDGVPVGTLGTAGTASSTRTSALISNVTTGSVGFKGDLAIALYYDRALTDAEINQIWQIYRGRFNI